MKAPIGMSNLGEAVRKHQDGALLDIFVNTEAKKNLFPTCYNKWRKRVEIKVISPPKDSMANIDVIKTSAKFFDTPIKNVWIVSGKKNKEKTLLVKGFSVNSLIKRLRESLNGL